MAECPVMLLLHLVLAAVVQLPPATAPSGLTVQEIDDSLYPPQYEANDLPGEWASQTSFGNVQGLLSDTLKANDAAINAINKIAMLALSAITIIVLLSGLLTVYKSRKAGEEAKEACQEARKAHRQAASANQRAKEAVQQAKEARSQAASANVGFAKLSERMKLANTLVKALRSKITHLRDELTNMRSVLNEVTADTEAARESAEVAVKQSEVLDTKLDNLQSKADGLARQLGLVNLEQMRALALLSEVDYRRRYLYTTERTEAWQSNVWALMERAKVVNPLVRRECVEALGEIAPPTWQTVQCFLDLVGREKDPHIKRRATEALQKWLMALADIQMPDKDRIEFVHRIVDDETISDEIKSTAAEVLRRLENES